MIIDNAELKRRYLQRIAGTEENKAYIGPEVVNLNLTTACNISCQYCLSHHAPGNPEHIDKTKFFPWDKFRGVIHDAVDLNVDQINLCGSGEPTIHPSFRDMMRHLEPQPLKVVLVTNATFPLEYCLDVIKADSVIINLSAVDRAQYRELTGEDFFDRVVANIERLVHLRDTGKPEFLIKITYIVNALNVHQKQKMQELAIRLGVHSVEFTRMKVHEYNQKVALPEDLEGVEKRTPPECLNGWFYMYIMSGGNFTFCYKIPQMLPGDIAKWSLKQYWFSAHMNRVRLLGKYGRIQKMYKTCETCAFYEENIGVKKDQRFWRPNEEGAQLSSTPRL